MRTFTILEELLPKLESRVATVRKKMSKYSNNLLYYSYSEPRFVEDANSSFYRHFVVDVTIEGIYRIDDWDFVGICEYHSEIDKNIIKTTPSNQFTIPSIYYTSCKCDHCHTHRPRKTTVLLYNNKTNKWKQVGSSCVKDYIGIDIAGYANYLSCIDSIEELQYEIPSPKSEEYFSIREIILQTLARVQVTGYISQNKAQELANKYESFVSTTASDVFHILNKSVDYAGNLLLPKYEITDRLEKRADDVISFINSLNPLDNEYLNNLKTLIQLNYVTNKNLGLVVSMVGYYLRETAVKQEVVDSCYVGEIGSTIEFTGTPECIYSYETEFGISHIYKFNVNSNILIWKTGKTLDTDTSITLRGRVKSHNEFRGTKQTEVTRCRIQ